MLRSLNILVGYKLKAKDGYIGRCGDFLFDDNKWCVRYMVADTATWLSERKVLVSPAVLQQADWASQTFPINLTMQEIKNSPPLAANAPVSRKYELAYNQHFGFSDYWHGTDLWGEDATPNSIMQSILASDWLADDNAGNGSHIRSIREVRGYTVEALDDEAGKVYDLIVDDETWAIRYLVISIGRMPIRRKVLVSPEWLRSVNWVAGKVYVTLEKQVLEEKTAVDMAKAVNHQCEKVPYDYYGRPHFYTNKFRPSRINKN